MAKAAISAMLSIQELGKQLKYTGGKEN